MKRRRNLIIARSILRGYSPKGVGEFFGITGQRAKQVTLRICSEHFDVGEKNWNGAYYGSLKSHLQYIRKRRWRVIDSINKELE